MNRYVCFVFCFILLAAHAAAQATVRAIDAYTKRIETHVEANPNSKIVYADVSDEFNSKAEWRKFGSEKEFEKYREDNSPYTIAYTWKKDRKLVATSLTFSSPSGDWVKYVRSTFRPDGTLAKAEVDYRTFHGDFIVEQYLYYSAGGKLLKKTTAYKDLETGKSKKPETDYLSDNSEQLRGDIYKSVQRLPFARIIAK